MPFGVKIKPEAEQLIAELELKYPRAAALIRLIWLTVDGEATFQELLYYGDSQNKLGFDIAAFKTISELHRIHQDEDLAIRGGNTNWVTPNKVQTKTSAVDKEIEARKDVWSKIPSRK